MLNHQRVASHNYGTPYGVPHLPVASQISRMPERGCLLYSLLAVLRTLVRAPFLVLPIISAAFSQQNYSDHQFFVDVVPIVLATSFRILVADSWCCPKIPSGS